MSAVHSLVSALVNIALLIKFFKYFLNGFHVIFVRRADKLVVGRRTARLKPSCRICAFRALLSNGACPFRLTKNTWFTCGLTRFQTILRAWAIRAESLIHNVALAFGHFVAALQQPRVPENAFDEDFKRVIDGTAAKVSAKMDEYKVSDALISSNLTRSNSVTGAGVTLLNCCTKPSALATGEYRCFPA